MHVQLTDHSATVHSYYLIGNVVNVPEIREQVYVLCFNQTRHAPTYLHHTFVRLYVGLGWTWNMW